MITIPLTSCGPMNKVTTSLANTGQTNQACSIGSVVGSTTTTDCWGTSNQNHFEVHVELYQQAGLQEGTNTFLVKFYHYGDCEAPAASTTQTLTVDYSNEHSATTELNPATVTPQSDGTFLVTCSMEHHGFWDLHLHLKENTAGSSSTTTPQTSAPNAIPDTLADEYDLALKI